MEWAIEKATELGVAAVAPVIAQRTEKHLAQAAEKRAERWRRIAHESAQQSRRSDVPLIHPPALLASRVRAASSAVRIVLAEQERTTTLRRLIEEAVEAAGEEMPALELAIGPEGGWAPAEEALFSTPMAGALQRWVRAFCARRRRQSRRWRWWLPIWNKERGSLSSPCRFIPPYSETPRFQGMKSR
jgi:16S rRNA U1498 N3-methylase RsmE